MALLSFQKPAVAACIRHMYKKERIKWNGIDIHPPAGVDASVSSGKSLMLCELAAAVKSAANLKGNRMRILVMQASGELCEQNSDAAWGIGLQNSCYSASLKRKSTHYDVIYGTTGTIYNALEKEFKEEGVDAIFVDEGHQIPYDDPESMGMVIFMHFLRLKPHLRIIMFSGSWFRGTESIIGEFWQKSLTYEPGEEGYPDGGEGNGKITTEWMAANGWVVPCVFGWPSDEHENSYADDFASLKTLANSAEFSEAELDAATSDVEKLYRILAEVVAQAANRNGVLMFCATQRHTKQVRAVLIALGVPEDQVGIVTDKTPEKERKDILARAKLGQCKYVLNVACLTTGINVSRWDVLVYLRPIGSLVLLIQSIGRVLRLLLEEGGPGMLEMDAMTAEERLALIAASPKPNALILDYGGVLDRLRDQYENPLLEQAEKEHATRKNELIECPACHEMNSMYARRCIGVSGGQRCEHFFQSKQCPDCGTKNDIVARACRDCGRQLIDPNEALSGKHYTDAELTPVTGWKFHADDHGKLVVRYHLADGREPYEIHHPNVGKTEQAKHTNRKLWRLFVSRHIPAGRFRDMALNFGAKAAMKSVAMFNTPTHISARYNEDSKRWTIGRVKFRESGIFEGEGE